MYNCVVVSICLRHLKNTVFFFYIIDDSIIAKVQKHTFFFYQFTYIILTLTNNFNEYKKIIELIHYLEKILHFIVTV